MGIRILGSIEVDGVDSTLLGGPLQRGALVGLALNLNRPVPRDRLIASIWEDPPPSATATLHGYLSHLRQALAPTSFRIEWRQSAYRLRGPEDDLDVIHFENLITTAEDLLAGGSEPELELADQQLRTALSLWRGDPLPGLTHQPGPRAAVSRLAERRVTAVTHLMRAQLLRGRHEECVPEVEAALEHNPFHEELWALLMICLYRCGRQAEALAAYRRVRQLLIDEQGLDPGLRLTKLERAILAHDPRLDGAEFLSGPRATPLPASPAPVPDAGAGTSMRTPHLPAWRTTFVGRRDELATLSRQLRGQRLITLVGPAGIGKSRLACELARAAAPGHGGADPLFVDASTVTAEEGLLRAVAAALHADGPVVTVQGIATAIRPRPSLIILDGAEQLETAAAEVCADLVETCLDLRLVVTSQCALQVRGEQLFEVGPLSLFAGSGFDREGVLASEAVRLLLDRGSSRADQDPTDTDLGAIDQIGRRLDGVPLALELAGAAARSLSWADVRDGLSDRFRLLALTSPEVVPRRTLLGAMEWSYALLNPDQKLLLRRLGVFEGAFDLASAEAVCSDDRPGRAEVAGLLAQLIGRSLVSRQPAGECCPYRLLETVREFARSQLERTPEESRRVSERHADYFLEYAEVARTHLAGTDGPQWHSAVHARELDITLAAHRLQAQGDLQRAARIAVAVGPFLEGRYRLRDLEASCAPYVASPEVEPATRARAAYLLAQAQFLSDRIEAAATTISQALETPGPPSVGRLQLRTLRSEIWRTENVDSERLLAELDDILADPRLADDPTAAAEARRVAANVCWETGDLEAARRHGDLARTHCQRLRLGRALAEANTYLSGITRDLGDLGEAEYLLRQARAFFDAMEDPMQAAYAEYALGRILLLRGRSREGLDLGRSSQVLFARIGDEWGVAVSQRLQGESALALGDTAEGERLLRTALDFMRQRGFGDDIAALSEALARCLLQAGEASQAETLCTDALVAYGQRSRGRQRGPLLTTLALAVLAQGEGKRARELAAEAVAACRASGSRMALQKALAAEELASATAQSPRQEQESAGVHE